MAFPTVESAAGQGFGSFIGSHAVDMPAMVNSGDRLIILFNINDADNSGVTLTTPSGWVLEAGAAMTLDARWAVYSRVADGSEGGTTVAVVSSESEPGVAHVYRISGASDVEVDGIAAEAIADTANPGEATPSWGAKDTLWIEVVFSADDGATASAFSTNYTNGITTTTGGGTGNSQPSIHSARRELNATSDDPDAVTLSEAERVVAMVVMVEPDTSFVNTDILVPTGPWR